MFHVMNRGARRLRIFEDPDEYQDFLACVILGLQKVPLRLLAYCVMPNHFHFVVWPREAGQLSDFMKLVTGTHSKRWHRRRGSTGTGCVYQGRYRAVPIERDEHFLTVCRYVERNALRAHLVDRAEEWPWSSLYGRCRNSNAIPLHPWPISPPLDWLRSVNQSEPQPDVEAIREAINRNRPFGSAGWEAAMTQPRPRRGRPRKKDVG